MPRYATCNWQDWALWHYAVPLCPARARVILSSIKPQASSRKPQAASRRTPQAEAACKGPKGQGAERPGAGPCHQATDRMWSLYLPICIETVLTNSTSASTPLHRDTQPGGGGEPASVLCAPPPSTLQKSNPIRSVNPILLNPVSVLVSPDIHRTVPKEKETSSCLESVSSHWH